MMRALRARIGHRALVVAEHVAALPLALRIVLVVIGVLHAVGIGWGLPASDTWDVDGIAPRDFIPGLAQTYTPGEYFTYPPLHLLLLAILNLPVVIAAAVHAHSSSVSAVLPEILAPSYMTTMAIVARIVSVLMSLGVVVALAKVAEETAPDDEKSTVVTCTALVVGLDAAFSYYAHVTNLDVPYLFWASLALLALVRAVTRRAPKRLRSAAIFAACAVATKDQAYAMFLLALPLTVIAFVALDGWGRANAKTVLREAFFAGAIAIAIVLVVDGALFNPSGFAARVRFLSGSASQDFATYSKDFGGRLLVVTDIFRAIRFHYSWPVLGLAAVGLAVALAKARRHPNRAGAVLATLVPLFAAISFTLFFNLTARRVEERFTLPQMLVVGLYAGRGLAAAWSWIAYVVPTRWPRTVVALARTPLALLLGPAVYTCLSIDATFLHEPRYEAERWLDEHARPGDVVEVHGLNVYLPRPPKRLTMVRVDRKPLDHRNPFPGIVEVRDELSNIRARSPRFIAVNDCYVWRYLPLPHTSLPRDQHAGGRILPRTQGDDWNDADATGFFGQLFDPRAPLGYRLALEARIPDDATFPRFEIHASLGCPMRVYERVP